jgi:hypothetical protein
LVLGLVLGLTLSLKPVACVRLEISQILFLFAAAVAAGALNSVAGGGGFISFPALILAGIPPIRANATSTMALWPGLLAGAVAYRRELAKQKHLLAPLISASVLGGTMGALLLLRTPPDIFLKLVPFLLLGATLLFTFGDRITPKATHDDGRPSRRGLLTASFVQVFISVYAGYFGAGLGMITLALLSTLRFGNIHSMNAVKTTLGTCSNGMAVVTFAAAGAILWPIALLMTAGAMAGGYFGAWYVQKLDPHRVRRGVVAIGFAMTGYFFVRTYLR